MLSKIPLVHSSSMLSIILSFSIATTTLSVGKTPNLLEARAGHKTELVEEQKSPYPIEQPPGDQFELVKYPTDIGDMYAYLSKHAPIEDKKHPAIVWLTGGFPVSSPGSLLWGEADTSNEQSARIYRIKDIITLFPTLRGGTAENPGFPEGFYGEVNDVIKAGAYLKSLDTVDPNRVYLGGHSTGGTLALLVAESTDIFAGVISLGPTHDDYGQDYAPYEWTPTERKLREPIHYLSSITSPTYILEGISGNNASLLKLKAKNTNENVKIETIEGASHFNLIHPVNTLFADAILASTDGKLNIAPNALAHSYFETEARTRESNDLRTLANHREAGIKFDRAHTVSFSLLAQEPEALKPAITKAGKLGLESTSVIEYKENDSTYYGIEVSTKIDLKNLPELFQKTQVVSKLSNKFELYYNGWSIKKP